MPDYRRWAFPGATYFFTVVTANRRPILTTPTGRECLRASIRDVRTQRPFDLWAIVLLPDHLHCIWLLPEGDSNFSTRWSILKRRFTQRWLGRGGESATVSGSRRAHREAGVWQRRYWEHWVRDDRELCAYRDYIHLNPVKHGFVAHPHAWKWSSVHRHIRNGWLAPDWTGEAAVNVDVRGEV